MRRSLHQLPWDPQPGARPHPEGPQPPHWAPTPPDSFPPGLRDPLLLRPITMQKLDACCPLALSISSPGPASPGPRGRNVAGRGCLLGERRSGGHSRALVLLACPSVLPD